MKRNQAKMTYAITIQILLCYVPQSVTLIGSWDLGLADPATPPPRPTAGQRLFASALPCAIAYLGDGLDDDTFTVSNGGAETLNYTISHDADWLSVSPDNGASTGEPDLIEVTYSVEALPFGPHPATITVTSTDAANSPQIIAINVTVETVGPDFDGDADVDMEDFGHLQVCFSGSGIVQNDPACFNALLDSDADVDQADFAVFQACLSGANIAADRTCDD